MKTNHIFIFLSCFLIIFLFISNEYDYNKNANKIQRYKCKQLDFTPFPSGFDFLKYSSLPHLPYNSSKNKYNNYSNLLNLEHLTLNKLPDNLFKGCKECIKSLSLGNNNFTEIPAALQHLPLLESLNLSNCQLTSLDYNHNFENLKFLFLQNNNISSLSFLPTAKYLNNVELVNNNIAAVELPNDASTYFVGILNLADNDFDEFPIELLRINGIRSLNLHKNKISFVPSLDADKSDYKINDISLTNNKLSQFPSTLGRVENLKMIELQGNNIRGKVEFLNNSFLSLQKLEIESQFVDSVIIGATALPNLTELNLFRNRISYFKADTSNVQSFTSLKLGENEFTEFPLDVLNFKNLQYCDLSKNSIEGKVIIKDADIEILDLSNNKITAIHFAGTNKITDLNINYNNLKSFTFEEGSLPFLNNLNIEGNPSFSPKKIVALNNRIQNLPIASLKGIINIKNNKNRILKLSDNDIREIYFSGNNKVKELLLENNDLRSIYIEKNSLRNLTLLDLSHNPNLKSFPFQIFKEAPNLKTIDIIGCSSLPTKVVDEMKRLAKENGVNYLSEGDINYNNN